MRVTGHMRATPAGPLGPPVLLFCLLALPIAWAAPGSRPPEAAVRPRAPDTPAVRPDSSDLVARARRTQRSFEGVRQRRLPRTRSRIGRCDETVGRFCLWHDRDEHWEPPPEHPAVTEARDSLLARLAVAAEELPGDAWIAGQRVRYLQEAGRHEEALWAARECRSTAPGWCEALAGYALHGMGAYARADSAFAVALRAMPVPSRCEWTDLSWLLDGRARKPYGELGCEERASFEALFWWLADPLWLVEGNDRRTEHLWRRVMHEMQQDATSGYGVSWGDDLKELLVRYGWPAGWERTRDRPGSLAGRAGTVAHDPPAARHFVPRGRWIEAPTRWPRGEWDPEPRRPRSLHAPAYARDIRVLDPRLSRFRRGDTAIVVASLEAGSDTLPPCEEMEVGLFLADGPEGRRAEARERTGGDEGTVAAALSAAPPAVLVGVEALCPGQARAARARFGLELPDAEPGISDLLLGRAEAGASLPTTPAEAAAVARGGAAVRPGERLVLYWEVYGARGSEATAVTVDLTRRGGGVFRALAEWTGLTGERDSVIGLRWADRSPEPGVWARSVGLEVPADARRGKYELRVTVTLDGGLPLRASRIVEVR